MKDVILDGEKIGTAERRHNVRTALLDYAERRYPAPLTRLLKARWWSFDRFMYEYRIRGRGGLQRWEETWRETEDAFILESALVNQAAPPTSRAALPAS